MWNVWFNVNRPIPVIEIHTLIITLFSGFFREKSAINKGTKITARLNKNPAFETEVVFNPITTAEVQKNNSDPSKNP